LFGVTRKRGNWRKNCIWNCCFYKRSECPNDLCTRVRNRTFRAFRFRDPGGPIGPIITAMCLRWACTPRSLNSRHTVPNTIWFTSHIFAHLCRHLSAQAANSCLKTHVGLPITSDSAAKSKWLQHDALSNYKLGMTKLTGIRHKHHKQEVAAHV
jgi:hypothetical protein